MDKLNTTTARRLHDEAPSMTTSELRGQAQKHFGIVWTRRADKSTMVRKFREAIEKFVVKTTGKPWKP